MFPRSHIRVALTVGALTVLPTFAEPVLSPGDIQLRHDIQLLNDSDVIDVPLTAWPISIADLRAGLEDRVDFQSVEALMAAVDRVKGRLRSELHQSYVHTGLSVSASENPRFIRSFEDTPRDAGEIKGTLSWMSDWFTINLAVTAVADPLDGNEVRPDGTYVGVAGGNWMISAGWQERWWGPGNDGSLILSTNARPSPGISVSRLSSAPFETKWLSWIGPWTLTAIMNELDDDRLIRNAWLFGVRGSFRPPRTGLEIGISRTAQWCGDSRPCDLSTFGDLLVGNDNRGVNVSIEEEPGNQLGGFDIRWKLPGRVPVALYMQWIGEDGRGGGGAIGSWLRQGGAEFWGEFGAVSHRTFIEYSDTTCQKGGFGFSGPVSNCAYNHFNIYKSGYRYQRRSLGHGIDGDGRSYSFGSTLVQSAGTTWGISLRYMEINRIGPLDIEHSISPTPAELLDAQVTYSRQTRLGRIYAGIGFSRWDLAITAEQTSDASAFLRWSNH